MRHKTLLLSSVSAISAAAALAPQLAHAADLMSEKVPVPTVAAAPDGFTVSLEGGAVFGPAETIDKTGGSGGPSLNNQVGGRGAITITKQIDPSWDMQAGAGVVRLLHNSTTILNTGSGASGGVIFDSDFGLETLDFDVGYTPKLDGKLNVRLFAGVRGMHYSDTLDKTGFSGGPNFGFTNQNEFIGAGPRVGIEGSTRMGDSNFGVSGMLAGAAIFGANSNKTTAFSGSGSGILNDATDGKTVYDLEAALGLDYYISDTSTFTLGYHAEELWNVRNGNTTPSFNAATPSTNQFLGGPFAKLKAGF